MATEVACPLCLNSSFSLVQNFITAFLNFFERPLNCPLCDHLACNATALKEHLNQHLTSQHVRNVKLPSVSPQESKKYACKQCGTFETNDIAVLRLHVESEHPERRFLCVNCCKLFKGTYFIVVIISRLLNWRWTYLLNAKLRLALRYIWEWRIRQGVQSTASISVNFAARSL